MSKKFFFYFTKCVYFCTFCWFIFCWSLFCSLCYKTHFGGEWNVVYSFVIFLKFLYFFFFFNWLRFIVFKKCVIVGIFLWMILNFRFDCVKCSRSVYVLNCSESAFLAFLVSRKVLLLLSLFLKRTYMNLLWKIFKH